MSLKRQISFGIAAALFMVLAAGCGKEFVQEERTKVPVTEIAISDEEAKPKAETKTAAGTVILQVTAVEGDTVTGITGTLRPQKAAPKPPEMTGGEDNAKEQPEVTDGEMSTPVPPEMTGKEAPTGSIFTASEEIVTFTMTADTVITMENPQDSEEDSDLEIAIGTVLEVLLDSTGNAEAVTIKNLEADRSSGGSSEVINGTSVTTIKSDKAERQATYTSEGDDENAVRVDGASVVFEEIDVEKSGGASSNTENGDFYGQNAGLLAVNGAQVTIQNSTVNTSAAGGNGIFSYGDGTVVNVFDSTIRTTENNSGGIMTTGGGTMNVSNLDIETQGNSSAAIRSDRGGGTVTADHGSYVTKGTGSPAVYCTADITVMDAVLIANASEAIVVEGKNSVTLKNCKLTGNMKSTYNGDGEENICGIMIYQSMSGDAEAGGASFCAEGGSIAAKAGDMFYVTNTDCEITLKDVAFTTANNVFLRVEGNTSSHGWGTSGENGGDAVLSTEDQKIDGNILVDEISSLDFTMKKGTEFSGAINPAGTGGAVHITMEEGALWTLTEDTYIDSISGDTTGLLLNGYQLIVDGRKM